MSKFMDVDNSGNIKKAKYLREIIKGYVKILIIDGYELGYVKTIRDEVDG